MGLTIFLKEASLFGIIQLLSLFIAKKIKIPTGIVSASKINSSDILIALAISTLLILIFGKIKASKSLFFVRFLWFVALWGGMEIFLDTFFSQDLALLLSIFLIIIYAKAATINFHNLILTLSLPGIGAILGLQLQPYSVIGLLLLLSLYDIVAVYLTGHMVKMAKQFIASGVVPGIIIRTQQSKDGPLLLSEVEAGKEEAAILGTGDLVLPTILSVSALQFLSLTSGLFSVLGSILGLFITHQLFFSQKERRPMPALPPIALGAITGFFLSLLFI